MQIPFADFVSHYATLVISVAAVVDYPKKFSLVKSKNSIPCTRHFSAFHVWAQLTVSERGHFCPPSGALQARAPRKRELRPHLHFSSFIFSPWPKSYWHRGGSMVSTPSARVRVI
jgi:hypothetical protein